MMTSWRSFSWAVLAGGSLLLASCGGSGHGETGGDGDGGHGGHASSKAGSSHSSSATTTSSRKGTASPAAVNARELLDLLEVGSQQDPSRFVEVEIGTFKVTHKHGDAKGTMLLKFRLFGIVPETKQEHLGEEMPKFEKRIRDAVISLVQKTDIEQLAEPGLKWLKAELVATINRVVQDRALQDVVFSDFSMEEV